MVKPFLHEGGDTAGPSCATMLPLLVIKVVGGVQSEDLGNKVTGGSSFSGKAPFRLPARVNFVLLCVCCVFAR